jgi:cellulose synthase/poly-beta-1,6-N-acetylglucosamine synthase-like glycosyltransferase
MVRLGRILFLAVCAVYFTLCVTAGLEVYHNLQQSMIAFFLAFGALVVTRYIGLMAAAIRDKKSQSDPGTQSWTPFVSIIVPAYNEENLIDASLSSLVSIDYPDFEIIVVDDGSSDGTVCAVHKVAARYPATIIKVIAQSNSGKSWALNTGIMHAHGELIVCVDSDSKLNRHALQYGVSHFKDRRVGAVGGYVNVINPHNIVTKLQLLEYAISQNFIRRALSFFSCVTVIPGPIGMFRKQAIQQAGGYSIRRDCFAEDADLTVRLLASGWKTKGETRMIAHTEAPNTLYSLLRQRYRWKRGIFQAMYDNFFPLIMTPNSKYLFVAGVLVFESFLFDVVNFGITLFAITNFLVFAKLHVFLWAFVFYCILDLAVLVVSDMNKSKIIQNLGLLLLLKVSYAYVLQVWGVFALFDEWLSTKMSWDKLERTGESFQV